MFWFLFAVAALVEGGSVFGQTPLPRLPSAATAASYHVVLISIDGFRPEFYTASGSSNTCPTLARLRDAGGYAKAALPPYPSLTYPGHASILTGVFPARHAVTANTKFSGPTPPEDRGFWFATDIRTPTICDAAHTAGLTVGAVSWPSTAGSKSIDWDVPEFWTTAFGNDMTLIRRYSPPGLLNEIEAATGPLTRDRLDDAIKHDAFIADSAIEIIRRHKPNLMLIHLIEADKVQHQGGRNAPTLPDAMRRIDTHIARIIEACKAAGIYERTTFIVLGDHGFADIEHSLAPNVLLIQNGFIMLNDRRVTAWKAMAQNTGGSAGVYLKDPFDKTTADRVRALFEKYAVNEAGEPLYRIIDKEQLTKLGGPSKAAFYLEAAPGYMFSGSLNYSTLVNSASIKGNHGYLPTRPGLQTGLIVAGRGIANGKVIETVRLVDVAPTVAQLLGLNLANTDGSALKEFLQDASPPAPRAMPQAALPADTRSVVLEPKKIHEECIELKSGEKLDYSFTSPQPVDFNIHYHKRDVVNYPVKRDSVKSSQDIFEAASDQEYCWMWTNSSTEPVTLVYRCKKLTR